MNISANRARSLSLTLLLSALLNHGVLLQSHDLAAGQQTSGMLRLARDLMRRTGGIPDDEQRVAAQISRVRVTSNG
jgi:hypothetical protein